MSLRLIRGSSPTNSAPAPTMHGQQLLLVPPGAPELVDDAGDSWSSSSPDDVEAAGRPGLTEALGQLDLLLDGYAGPALVRRSRRIFFGEDGMPRLRDLRSIHL